MISFRRAALLPSLLFLLTFFETSKWHASAESRVYNWEYEGVGEGRLRAPGYIELGQLEFYCDCEVDVFVLPFNDGGFHEDVAFQQGIGIRNQENRGFEACCLDYQGKRADDEMCSDDQNRLIFHQDKFQGYHGKLTIQRQNDTWWNHTWWNSSRVNVTKSGRYLILPFRCGNIDDDDRNESRGYGLSIWKHAHGFLPPDLLPAWVFYAACTILYLGLFAWYGLVTIRTRQQETADASLCWVQKHILCLLFTGLFELSLRLVDFVLWNSSNERNLHFIQYAFALGALKQGFGRVAMVLHAKGQQEFGSGSSLCGTAFLYGCGILYALLFRTFYRSRQSDAQDLPSEDESFDFFVVVLSIGVALAAMDFIFMLWIGMTLESTTLELQRDTDDVAHGDGASSLVRYTSLDKFAVPFFVVSTILWGAMFWWARYSKDGILRERAACRVYVLNEVTFVVLLLAVAMIWKPGESSELYARVSRNTVDDADNVSSEADRQPESGIQMGEQSNCQDESAVSTEKEDCARGSIHRPP